MGKRIFDLSYDLEAETPVYPKYPHVEIALLDSTERQKPDGPRHLNSSVLTIGLHCGTHMDAPFHFFGAGKTIEETPLHRCIGPAVLVSLPDHGANTPILPDDLQSYAARIQKAGKVVFHTGWSSHWGQPDFFTDHPVISGEAAQMLVDCGVHLVGVDFPSVDQPPHSAHVILLGNGVLIVENLTNLDAIGAAQFHLTALPMKIVGRDGSPVRAIAQEL